MKERLEIKLIDRLIYVSRGIIIGCIQPSHFSVTLKDGRLTCYNDKKPIAGCRLENVMIDGNILSIDNWHSVYSAFIKEAINETIIVDHLNSDESGHALSAKQGRILKDMIEEYHKKEPTSKWGYVYLDPSKYFNAGLSLFQGATFFNPSLARQYCDIYSVEFPHYEDLNFLESLKYDGSKLSGIDDHGDYLELPVLGNLYLGDQGNENKIMTFCSGNSKDGIIIDCSESSNTITYGSFAQQTQYPILIYNK